MRMLIEYNLWPLKCLFLNLMLGSIACVAVGQDAPVQRVLDSTKASLVTQTLPIKVEHGMFDSATGNFFGYKKAEVDAPTFSSGEFVEAVVASAEGRFEPVKVWLPFEPSKMVLKGDRLILFNLNSFKVYDATNFKPLAGFSINRKGKFSFNGNVMSIGVLKFDLDQLSSSVDSSSDAGLFFKEGTLRDGILYRDEKPVLLLGNVSQGQALKWGLHTAEAQIIDRFNRPPKKFPLRNERGESTGYDEVRLEDKGLLVRAYNANQIFVSMHANKPRNSSPQGRASLSDLDSALEKVVLTAPRFKTKQYDSPFRSSPICASSNNSIYIVVGNKLLNWSAEELITKNQQKDAVPLEIKKEQDAFVITKDVQVLKHRIIGGKPPYRFELQGKDPFLKIDAKTGAVTFANKAFLDRMIQGGLNAPELKSSFVEDYQKASAEQRNWAKEKLGVETRGRHRRIRIGVKAKDSAGTETVIYYYVIACIDLEPHLEAISKIKKRYLSAEEFEKNLSRLEKQFEFLSK